VKKTNGTLEIDGHPEALWDDADSAVSFTQLEPARGSPSSRETVVKALQDDENVYFFFACQTLDREEPAARIQRRDQLDYSDDIITIVLDTYNDRRTAFMFQVNALGTLADAKINDDGKNVDYLWDAEWKARSAVSDKQWTVEIAIPFQSIQFKPGTDAWGVNFSRSVRANNEIAWWTPVTENNRVSQNGSLLGIRPWSGSKHSLYLFPYATGRHANSNISEIEDGFKADFGGDIEYKYSSNLKANLTVNPDFATVEGDKEQINLTPWELRFPDKRLFFQDGNEMFSTRIQTFYSRRIGDILYGVKATGKVDRFQFNGLHARTKEDQSLQFPAAYHNAFRLKGDILESSTLGFTYTDKITDTAAYRSYNLDYVLNLGKTWKLTGQYVLSTPGDVRSHSGWFVRFARENNIYHYHVRFTSLGQNFQDNVNQTGFIPDDDRLEVDSDVEYKFWINRKLRYLFLSGLNNMFWSQQGTLRSWRFNYGSRLYFMNKMSVDLYYRNEFQLLEKKYYNHYYHAITGYNTDEASYVATAYRFGKNFDRDFQLAELTTSFNVLKKLTVSYELNYLHFDPDTTGESTWLNVLGLDYYFTNDLWIRVFAQNNSSTDKYYFYGLVGWRFRPPFGAVYLIVNTDNYFDPDRDMSQYAQIVFLKVTYPIPIIR
jgi:hypothetical protein